MMSHPTDTEKPHGLTGGDTGPTPLVDAQAPADAQARPDALTLAYAQTQPEGSAAVTLPAGSTAPTQPEGSTALTLTVAGRTVVFVDLPSFDFALCARTRVSAEAQTWFSALDQGELDGELLWVRRANRQSERLLRERYAGRDAGIQELLPEHGAFPADEFGWGEIIRQLAQASRTERGFADVALVRFSEYLLAREAMLMTARRQLRSQQRDPLQPEVSVGVTSATSSHPLDPLLHTEDNDAGLSESLLAKHGRPTGPEIPPTQTAEPTALAGSVIDSDSSDAGAARTSRSRGDVGDAPPRSDRSGLPTPQLQRLPKGKREEVQMDDGQPLVLFCGSTQITLVDNDTFINADSFSHRLAPGPNVIGRDPACDLVLQGHQISRMHVVVVSHGNRRYSLTDLSRNGTWWLRVGETAV
jgi:hypothetical protein